MLRAVAQHFPEASIHFATKVQYQELLRANPYIHQCHLLGDDWKGFVNEFDGLHFDFYIDLHKNLRTQRLRSSLSYDRYISFDKKNFAKWLLVNLKINQLAGDSLLNRYFDSLASIGIQYDGKGLDYYLGSKKGQFARLDELLPKDSFDVIALGGKHQTKKAPIEKLQWLLSQKKGFTVLLGGPTEEHEAQLLEVNASVLNLAGKLSLSESAYVISQSKKVVANDTGMMHIAAAFDRDLAVLWGSTVREFGFAPIKPDDSKSDTLHFENKDIKCRPCSKLGHKSCPKGHFKCMMDLDYERLANWLNQ